MRSYITDIINLFDKYVAFNSCNGTYILLYYATFIVFKTEHDFLNTYYTIWIIVDVDIFIYYIIAVINFIRIYKYIYII